MVQEAYHGTCQKMDENLDIQTHENNISTFFTFQIHLCLVVKNCKKSISIFIKKNLSKS